jgi:hypothetical protein
MVYVALPICPRRPWLSRVGLAGMRLANWMLGVAIAIKPSREEAERSMRRWR